MQPRTYALGTHSVANLQERATSRALSKEQHCVGFVGNIVQILDQIALVRIKTTFQ
jgi:hypothetical protein